MEKLTQDLLSFLEQKEKLSSLEKLLKSKQALLKEDEEALAKRFLDKQRELKIEKINLAGKTVKPVVKETYGAPAKGNVENKLKLKEYVVTKHGQAYFDTLWTVHYADIGKLQESAEKDEIAEKGKDAKLGKFIPGVNFKKLTYKLSVTKGG